MLYWALYGGTVWNLLRELHQFLETRVKLVKRHGILDCLALMHVLIYCYPAKAFRIRQAIIFKSRHNPAFHNCIFFLHLSHIKGFFHISLQLFLILSGPYCAIDSSITLIASLIITSFTINLDVKVMHHICL